MKGRKPKPIEQKVREGNPGGHKLPEPVRLPIGGVVKPSDLPLAAAALWDDLAPILSAANVLTRVDAAVLEALVIQWQRARDARGVLEAEGYFSFGSTGQLVEHPALGIERAAIHLLLRLAEQIGITPVSRARIASAAAVARSMHEELSEALELDI